MTKKRNLITFFQGMVLLALLASAVDVSAAKWSYGKDEFNPEKNKDGTAFTFAASGYDVAFSLLAHHYGSTLDGWVRTMTLQAADVNGDYADILTVSSTNEKDPHKAFNYESSEFPMVIKVHRGTFLFQNIKNSTKGTSVASTSAAATLTFTRKKGDEATRITTLWTPNKEFSGKRLRFRVVATVMNRHDVNGDKYTNDLSGLFDVVAEVDGVMPPSIFEPMLGSIMGNLTVGYFANDDIKEITAKLDPVNPAFPKKEMKWPLVSGGRVDQSGTLNIPATDYAYDMKVNFVVYRGTSRVETPVDASPDKITFPAYHSIHNFNVAKDTSHADFPNVYRGHKKITWEIWHSDQTDVFPDDVFEIQRSSDQHFTIADQVAVIRFDDKQFSKDVEDHPADGGRYPCRLFTYIDSTQTALNSDSVRTPMYYRIRRATSAIWGTGWVADYSASSFIQEPVYLALPYITDESKIFRKGANYATKREVEITIPFTPNKIEGKYFWWDRNARIILNRHWQTEPTADNPNPDVQTATIVIPGDSVKYENGNWVLRYTDHAAIPCVKYHYSLSVQRASAVLPVITSKNASADAKPVARKEDNNE